MFSFFSRDNKDNPGNARDPTGRRTNDPPFKGRSSEPRTEVQKPLPGALIHVRSMIEGTGGTFAFRNFSEATNVGVSSKPGGIHTLQPGEYIGTTKCRTCVGVYFEIGSDRCFCAHLNFSNKRVDRPRPVGPQTSSNAEKMREAIKRRLGQYQNLQKWKTEDVKKQSLIVVCPVPGQWTNAVLDGITDFLGILPGEKSIIKHAHGFVIQPGQPKSMRIIAYDHNAPERKEFGRLDGYQLNGDMTLLEREWQYSCPDSCWFVEFGQI